MTYVVLGGALNSTQ